MPKPKLRHKFVASLLVGRFEPIELVLAVSAVLHGAWLMFPYWTYPLESITGVSRWYEVTIAVAFTLCGAMHITGLIARTRLSRLRKYGSFGKFLLWGFLSWLAFLATGPTSVVWFPYLTLWFVSGLIYLNISVGVPNGTD